MAKKGPTSFVFVARASLFVLAIVLYLVITTNTKDTLLLLNSYQHLTKYDFDRVQDSLRGWKPADTKTSEGTQEIKQQDSLLHELKSSENVGDRQTLASKQEELAPAEPSSMAIRSDTINPAIFRTVADEKSNATTSETPSIYVTIATDHFFTTRYERKVPNCTYKEKLMNCEYSRQGIEKADVLFYHMPSSTYDVKRIHPNQLLVGVTMEPEYKFPQQKDPVFLKKFDIIMSYKRTSEVPLLYYSADWVPDYKSNGIFQPVRVKTSDKLPMLAYFASNCNAKNGRNDIIKEIMDIGDIEVHSYGRCLNNKEGVGRHWKDKLEIISKYKFCIAMENSNEVDYVTEKLWQSLAAGCLPVYYGAPNIADYLPVPVNKMIINYADLNNPKALSDKLVQIINDDKLYEEFFEWKKIYPRKDKLLPGFNWLVEVAARGHSQCELCKYAMNVIEGRSYDKI